MNKKVMALAVAGAFTAPAAALAQSSNVQIFGTMYMEYAYANQGSKTGTAPGNSQLNNIDIMQSPGSEIGFKGEEALGGGMSAWFQCASTADLRGAGVTGAASTTGFSGQQGIFCGRNSAIGLKGAYGNVFLGNWDMPMKTLTQTRILSDTGIWGTAGLLFGNSSTFIDNGPSTSGTSTGSIAFSRRQNSSIFYTSPVFSGFQVLAAVSSPQSAIGLTSNVSGVKARNYGIGASYTNGPLVVTGAWEQHSNFQSGAGAYAANASTLAAPTQAYAGTDNGYTLGVSYQFGPVKVGGLYVSRKYDTGNNSATCGAIATTGNTDMKIQSYNLAGEWAVSGPHAIRGGYTKAQDTKGSCTGGGQIGNVIVNGGLGGTGASIWQAQYVYNASKRTELTAGYVQLTNDTNAVYALGGAATPSAGQRQSAFAISIKNTF